MPAPRIDLAERVLTAVLGVRRVVRRRARTALPGPHLPGSQVELLRVVHRNPGIGVAAAARELNLAGNSVSTLVNVLTEAGLLRREVDPADRRAARLQLTDAAKDRMAVWRRTRIGLVSAALAELSEEDTSAIVAALPALERLTEALKEDA
ncbi:MarR family winged helix-turn-helix transcriptional regulator [Amycolatopsis echigonensis]|uniref:MarR family transcriptional regulator n=1 Tax=Amycolatopsis echigonensis TaxID=2576905 RepID=A0A2N3WPQ5_9PSEU|nr:MULTISPECIES: MarR family transcriptional regulator [Amycolatopsis]MBB2505013.1 MarR family transcriptional regulator [Amycolatopsis echigonensis]PKV95857.1 DNA-binding MarR family transcriptional regulator [Amycolatopsis niigatensis]